MMEIIARGRRAGKTHDLVQWVLDGEQTDSYPGWSRVLITHSINEADRIRHDYPDLDYRQVFSAQEWNGRYAAGTRQVEIAIDNVEFFLMMYFGQTPSKITLTGVSV